MKTKQDILDLLEKIEQQLNDFLEMDSANTKKENFPEIDGIVDDMAKSAKNSLGTIQQMKEYFK